MRALAAQKDKKKKTERDVPNFGCKFAAHGNVIVLGSAFIR